MIVLIVRAVTITMTVLMATMVTIPAEDSEYYDVFPSNSMAEVFKHTSIKDYYIDLIVAFDYVSKVSVT